MHILERRKGDSARYFLGTLDEIKKTAEEYTRSGQPFSLEGMTEKESFELRFGNGEMTRTHTEYGLTVHLTEDGYQRLAKQCNTFEKEPDSMLRGGLYKLQLHSEENKQLAYVSQEIMAMLVKYVHTQSRRRTPSDKSAKVFLAVGPQPSLLDKGLDFLRWLYKRGK
ncbi:MAG TPA: hypothetical protein VJH88_03440 [Candidatus Nanoarchaeia archaeon]|nr:hypothetical protein [Candidatus Nanoarchaeia archaeon]